MRKDGENVTRHLRFIAGEIYQKLPDFVSEAKEGF